MHNNPGDTFARSPTKKWKNLLFHFFIMTIRPDCKPLFLLDFSDNYRGTGPRCLFKICFERRSLLVT
ncbi:hypothetical protein AVDCRST_MAG84-419 [uncultured Microcoleus sp.]|uniref:Uncharacterized protein n=1 Tax=uncultured Microcoleus sp. TaxID=259945 RepID=A0A6J4KGV2_9CYAN|nr:hypothetical protein AVDCRST_MAG84-419 [uncultured Microcoleus sp.]